MDLGLAQAGDGEPFEDSGSLPSSPRQNKLSSYQDAECSLCSESCWHNFDPDVRAICERVSMSQMQSMNR